MSYIKRVGLFLGCISTLIHATTPYFGIRSQSQDTARQLAGWTQETHLFRPEQCTWYGTVAGIFEYTDSFSSNDLVRCLFDSTCLLDDCGIPGFAISGSRVPNRNQSDWLADYFGLPTDFTSTVTLSPHINNIIASFDSYFGLDNWVKGLFVRLHAPIVRTKWSLDFRENVTDSGELGYDAGYFTDADLPRNALLDTFTQFITGEQVPDVKRGLQLYQAFVGVEITSTDAVTFEPLKCAKWADNCCERSTETRLSDIHFALGYDFYNEKKGRFGASLQVVAPTGNRPKGEFFFEPIVGNGHHWELGIGLTGAWIPWRSCGKSRFGVYFDGVITHLFNDTQCRVFDLKSGCNSRYMLALKLGTPVIDLFAHPNPQVEDGAVEPIAQFISTFSPVANLTKHRVDVSVGVQADMTLMLSYVNRCGNCTFDFGYNFWTRSCENITISSNCDVCTSPLADGKTWALKGDSHVFGYTNIVIIVPPPCPVVPDPLFGFVVPLSPSQECATIHTGLNNFVGPDPDEGGFDGLSPTQNPGVDNAEFAQTTEDAAGALQILDRFNPDDDGLPIKTSNNPVFLSLHDLDLCGARKKKMSHKLFSALSYRWPTCNKKRIPYVSLGAKVEIGRTSSGKCGNLCISTNPRCPTQRIISSGCNYCTLSEWGIWLKGGVSF